MLNPSSIFNIRNQNESCYVSSHGFAQSVFITKNICRCKVSFDISKAHGSANAFIFSFALHHAKQSANSLKNFDLPVISFFFFTISRLNFIQSTTIIIINFIKLKSAQANQTFQFSIHNFNQIFIRFTMKLFINHSIRCFTNRTAMIS